MNDVEKCLNMYEMMAERCRKTGMSSKQAEAYDTIRAFLSDCSSGEEMMEKLKNNPEVYQNVSKGVVLDKLFALKKAAEDNGYEELASIYNKRYLEVENDYNKAFVTGYEKEVNEFHRSHLEDIRCFVDTFVNYIEFKGAYPDEKHFNDMKSNFSFLLDKGHDFRELSKTDEFRRCILLKDIEYENYLNDVEKLVKIDFDNSTQMKKVQETFENAWSVLKEKEKTVKELGGKESAKCYRASFMVIPPKSEEGKYEFIMEEREAME